MINKFLLRLGIPLAAWLLIYYSSLINMIGVWNNSKTYEHCYLILPISLWLVWQEKDKLKNVSFSISWLPVILLIFPCLLWIIGRTASIAFFEHIAAVTSLQLIIWAMIGNKFAKKIYFPILYLTFCIPFGEELIPYLQEITADISVYLVRLSGVPIYREGMYLTVPNGQFEVAEACSGIRFLISSIALGTLFSYIFFKKWWKFFLFIIFTSIFPIIANGLRAYGIIMIGNLSNMKYAAGADHLIYGWVFFSIVIIFMFFVAWYFQDKLSMKLKTTPPITKIINKKHDQLKVSFFIIVILFAFITWDKLIPSHHQHAKIPLTLPKHLKITNSSDWKISFPQAKQTILATSDKDTSFELFIARYYHENNQGELISSKNSLYDKNRWTLSNKINLSIENTKASALTLINIYGSSKNIIYWYCINEKCSSNPLKIKILETYYLLKRQDVTSDIFAISSSSLSLQQLQKTFIDLTSTKKGNFN